MYHDGCTVPEAVKWSSDHRAGVLFVPEERGDSPHHDYMTFQRLAAAKGRLASFALSKIRRIAAFGWLVTEGDALAKRGG